MTSFRLTLLSAADPDRPGSMRRYGQLVRQALESLPAPDRPVVTTVCVAPSPRSLPPHLRRFSNWWHHAVCALRVRRRVLGSRPDLVHLLDGSHGYLLHLLPRPLSAVATVHDVIPLLTLAGELPGPPPSLFGRWLWRRSLSGLRKVGRVLADSRSTWHDLERIGGQDASKMDVVHLPVCDPDVGELLDASDPASMANSAVPIPVLLHVGHNGAYKNREGVLRTVLKVRDTLPIRAVMVGPEPSDMLKGLVAELGLAETVEWRRDVTDEELSALYREADVFLFPSRYEGFGWPPLEAMAARTPVVCSNVASLPEVVGDAALTAGPDDYDALAQHCVSILTDRALRERLVAAGRKNLRRFTMERFAEKLLAVYRNALAEKAC